MYRQEVDRENTQYCRQQHGQDIQDTILVRIKVSVGVYLCVGVPHQADLPKKLPWRRFAHAAKRLKLLDEAAGVAPE
jgi:hypothetical protein